MIHFVCEDNKSNDDGRFFRLRSSGRFDGNVETSFFGKRYRDFFGKGGQISPNCEVISSIKDEGGVRRLTIEIEWGDSIGDDDKQGEIGANEYVESVRSIVSCLIIVGDDDDELFWSIDDDEHKQWPNDVTVLNNVNRMGICFKDELVCFNEWRRSESCNKRSLES